MSEVITDKLTGRANADDVTITAGSATMKLHDGVVKAYGMIDGTGTVNLITSLNASSVTDNGTGDYTFNINNNMSNSTYMFMINSHNETTLTSNRCASKYTGGQAAGSFRFTVAYTSNTSGGATKYDEDFNPITLLGDLA